jgi:hypothetical protein
MSSPKPWGPCGGYDVDGKLPTFMLSDPDPRSVANILKHRGNPKDAR